MNATRILLVGALLAGGVCASAPVQGAQAQSQQAGVTQDGSKAPAAQANNQASTAPSEQPVSLAEAARLARANKTPSDKPAKKYDDDNFPRSTPLLRRKPAEEGAAKSSVEQLPDEELKGKLVLLDFWASWCGPCRAGVPNVRRMQAIYGSEEFTVISVSEDDDESTWSRYIATHEMTWTQRYDSGGSLQHRFQVEALPTYILLDRDGQELQRWVGEDPGRSILERIGPAVKRRLQASL